MKPSARRRESERETTNGYFSSFSPRSRNNSTTPNDVLSPLGRSSPLSTMNGNLRDVPTNQHPLAQELHSLRSSLGKFQHVAHKTSMQLQGKALEVVLVQEEAGWLRDENRVLREEVQALRNVNETQDGQSTPPPSQDPSNALSELTLAHRRLCAKMDVSEETLHQAQTALSLAETENERTRYEVEEMQGLGGQWRKRIEEGRQEMEMERLERRKAEEELKICKLALAEYEGKNARDIVDTSDTSGQRATPTSDSTATEPDNVMDSSHISLVEPDLPASTPPISSSALPTTNLPSTPSNILLGVQGLHRLFTEFQTSLVEKEGKIAQLEMEVAVHEVEVQTEREMVKKVIAEKEEIRRELNAIKADDGSASKVVERYMAFTQKTTQQQHSNFQSQTTRLNQTINTLRHQLLSTQTLLDRETARTAQLRSAIDELAEGYERETFGRRREVALRMKSLEREARRLEAGRRWAERVRRERSRLGGVAEAGGTLTVGGRSVGMARSTSPFVSPAKSRPNLLHASPSSTSLASINTSCMNPYEENQHLSTLWDLLESGIELFVDLDDEGLAGLSTGMSGYSVDDQAARSVLVQGWKDSLMEELEAVTRKNVELEKQRLQWIATGTVQAEQPDAKRAEAASARSIERPLPVLPVTMDETTNQDASQYRDRTPASGGLQLNINGDVGHVGHVGAASGNEQSDDSLVTLLQNLARTVGRFDTVQKQLSDCAASVSNLRDYEADISPAYASTLRILLDGISDVVEDVRVEVEIAIADDERDLAGYRTILKLNPDAKTLSKAEEFADSAYVAKKSANFAKRLADVEGDLVGIKVAVCELQVEGPKSGLPSNADEEVVNPLLGLPLKTVRAPVPPSRATMQQRQLGNGMKRGFFGSLGRTLSGSTPALPISRGSSVSQHSPLSGLGEANVSPGYDNDGRQNTSGHANDSSSHDVEDVE